MYFARMAIFLSLLGLQAQGSILKTNFPNISSPTSALIQTAFDPQRTLRERWRALIAAAEAGHPRHADFDRALQSKDWFMRNAALIAWTKIHPGKAKAAALQALKDRALIVRSAAVDILKSHLDGPVRQALWSEFHQARNGRRQKNLWIHEQIFEVLASSPVASERQTYAKIANGSDKGLQAMAQQALQKL